MLLQCALGSWVCLFVLSCRKIIKGILYFIAWSLYARWVVVGQCVWGVLREVLCS